MDVGLFSLHLLMVRLLCACSGYWLRSFYAYVVDSGLFLTSTYVVDIVLVSYLHLLDSGLSLCSG